MPVQVKVNLSGIISSISVGLFNILSSLPLGGVDILGPNSLTTR